MLVGTLSKALGSYGGYVCARREIVELLVNSARALIFSTAPPPPAVAGAQAALELLVEQPRRPEKLLRPRPTCCAASSPRPASRCRDGRTQIVPVIVGDADEAVRALRGAARARRLRPGDPPADGARRQLAPAPDA